MPTLTISLDGVALKEIALSQPRTTLGRRPYNDIVVDNLAVSGEHAVLVQKPQGLELIDLNSTSGTYVNGKALASALLQPDDLIEIGRYQMRVTLDTVAPVPTARIRVLSGPAAGKAMTLTKKVTTLGTPGVAVAAINHRATGYTFRLVDGNTTPLVNGQPIGKEPAPLNNKDVISLAGTEMQFLS